MKYCKYWVLLLVTFGLLGTGFAQSKQINIKLTDKFGKPFQMAVVLYHAKTKNVNAFSMSKTSKSFTDTLGIAKLKVDSASTYFVRITWVGYQTLDTTLTFTSSNILSVILKEA
jgi:hypothetical protein